MDKAENKYLLLGVTLHIIFFRETSHQCYLGYLLTLPVCFLSQIGRPLGLLLNLTCLYLSLRYAVRYVWWAVKFGSCSRSSTEEDITGVDIAGVRPGLVAGGAPPSSCSTLY